jgi:hypothetical protein
MDGLANGMAFAALCMIVGYVLGHLLGSVNWWLLRYRIKRWLR